MPTWAWTKAAITDPAEALPAASHRGSLKASATTGEPLMDDRYAGKLPIEIKYCVV
ncbi:MAG TPA: hypothetical protein VFT91_09845 [Dehalococcoidia bacterium]|nr:hypothetical protein [Dehalococcoidia bacterium]